MEPELAVGDRIVYHAANGAASTGVLIGRVRKPGMSGLQCWAVDWDDIGAGVATDDARIERL